MSGLLLAFGYGLVGGVVAVAAYKWTVGRLSQRRPAEGTGVPWPHGTGIPLTDLPLTGGLVYRCPTHGLIESPTWHEDEIPEDSRWYCPINLTGKDGALHDGITDEVCGKDVTGPYFLRSDVVAPSDA